MSGYLSRVADRLDGEGARVRPWLAARFEAGRRVGGDIDVVDAEHEAPPSRRRPGSEPDGPGRADRAPVSPPAAPSPTAEAAATRGEAVVATSPPTDTLPSVPTSGRDRQLRAAPGEAEADRRDPAPPPTPTPASAAATALPTTDPPAPPTEPVEPPAPTPLDPRPTIAVEREPVLGSGWTPPSPPAPAPSTAAARESTAQDAAPVVHVTIGRVELRTRPTPGARHRARQPAATEGSSLEDYLDERGRGSAR